MVAVIAAVLMFVCFSVCTANLEQSIGYRNVTNISRRRWGLISVTRKQPEEKRLVERRRGREDKVVVGRRVSTSTSPAFGSSFAAGSRTAAKAIPSGQLAGSGRPSH
jgi:hypothetical protein